METKGLFHSDSFSGISSSNVILQTPSGRILRIGIGPLRLQLVQVNHGIFFCDRRCMRKQMRIDFQMQQVYEVDFVIEVTAV